MLIRHLVLHKGKETKALVDIWVQIPSLLIWLRNN